MSFDSWPGGSWQATLTGAIAILVTYWVALSLTLIFWTYRDIRQRTRDPITQTVAVLLVLIFNLPGLWLYLILRPRYTLAELYERSLEEEALLQDLEDQKACPTCKRRVTDEYLICPSCRTQLKEPCRQCSKPLSYAWLACPFCGLEKPPREMYGPRPARPPRERRTPRPEPARSEPAPKPEPVRPAATRRKPAEPAARPEPLPQRDPFAPRAVRSDEPMIGGGAE